MKRLIIFLVIVLLALPVSAQDDGLSSADINRISQSVVQIVTYDGREPIGAGSGTLVSGTGTIYTNRHVIEGGDDFLILILEDINEPPEPHYLASLVTVVEEIDFAVLQIDRDLRGDEIDPSELELPFINPKAAEVVERGDVVYIFGYPGIGDGYLVYTEGRITTVQNGDIGGRRMPLWYQTDAEIAPGNSGGLAVNAEGEIVGIPTEVLFEEQTGGRLGGILSFAAIVAMNQAGEIALAPNTEIPDTTDNSDTPTDDAFTLDNCPNIVEYGDSVTAQINNEEWGIIYCFEAAEDDIINIEMNTLSGDLDGYLLLFYTNFDNIQAENDDRSGSNLSPSIETFTVPEDGIYIIVATRYDFDRGTTEGEFELTISSGASEDTASPENGSDAPTPVAFQPAVQLDCAGGTSIANGTKLTLVNVPPGATFTTTVLGMGAFDPVLAVFNETTNRGACNDNNEDAASISLSLPGLGVVSGTSSSAQVRSSQNSDAPANMSLAISGTGGSGGEFLVVIDGLAITSEDDLGDLFSVIITETMAQSGIPVTAYMISKERGLDSYMNLVGEDLTVLSDADRQDIFCDDAGTRYCWGLSDSLNEAKLDFNGTVYEGKSSDAMIQVPMDNLPETPLHFLATSFEQDTAGDYLIVFHIGISAAD